MESSSKANLKAVRLIDLTTSWDERGALTVIEGGTDTPFEIRRCYLLHHLNGTRGGHAHRETNQLIIAAAGSCHVHLSDAINTEKFILNSPTHGLILGPMLWIELPFLSIDALIIVLASTHYDNKKVIRDKNQYLNLI